MVASSKLLLHCINRIAVVAECVKELDELHRPDTIVGTHCRLSLVPLLGSYVNIISNANSIRVIPSFRAPTNILKPKQVKC